MRCVYVVEQLVVKGEGEVAVVEGRREMVAVGRSGHRIHNSKLSITRLLVPRIRGFKVMWGNKGEN